jgi:hypothetical protein
MTAKPGWGNNTQHELDRIQAEGLGVMRYYVLLPSDLANLMGHAIAGDAFAARLMDMLDGAYTNLRVRHPPALCLLCEYEFIDGHDPVGWVLMIASVDEPETGLCNALCPRCARHDDLPERIKRKFEETLLKDAKGARIVPTPQVHGVA